MSEAANWYHCNVEPIGRSEGRSVVAAAAYRCGEKLHDERTNQSHDYTRRGGVEASFIVAPAHAPEWARDWGKLWNAAEAAEVKCNARTAREVKLALPASVSAGEREQIARKLAGHLVERYGVAAAVALHEPSRHGDQRNYHAHILMTTRRMEAEGLGKKTRELDDKKTGAQEIKHIREYAAALINESLAGSGSNERVDSRSNKARGIEQLPTQHLGVEAAAKERRGEHSRIGDHNRDITSRNRKIKALQKDRAALDADITREQDPTAYRAQHYDMARRQYAAIKKPKTATAARQICESAGYEFIRKRRNQYGIEPPATPPINPFDPTPGGSHSTRIKKQREIQDRGMDR
jgi:hypothetical protein